ncbi:MAG: antibiotic biosynthesis monooxygenase [Aquificae bacterium]|nr:antibiotic biosynthesis monooxygenase [Aquificota bacterium]
MIAVFTKFQVNEQYKEDFKKHALERFGQKGLQEQEGFVKMELLFPVDFPPNRKNNQFILITYWKDMKALMDYTNSEAFRKAHENPPPKEWFTAPPTIEVYEVAKEG